MFEKNILSEMCDDEENDENETLEASDTSTLNDNVTADSSIIEDQGEIKGIMKDDVYLEGMQGQMHNILNGLEEQHVLRQSIFLE